MLVKRDQEIRIVPGAQYLTGPDAHLENGWPAGNGGRDRHERHDFLLAPPGQSRQKATDGLNAVLRIPRYPNDRFGDLRNLETAARHGGGDGCFVHEKVRLTVLMSVGKFTPALEVVEGA